MISNNLDEQPADFSAEASGEPSSANNTSGEQAPFAAQDAQRHVARITALAAVSSSLAQSTHNLAALLQLVAQQSGSVLGGSAVIRLLSEDNKSLELAAVYHPNPATEQRIRARGSHDLLTTDQMLITQALKTQQAVVFSDLQSEQAQQAQQTIGVQYLTWARNANVQSIMVAPILLGERLLGVLVVSQLAPGPAYSEEDRRFLQDLAGRIASAIEYSKLVKAEQRARLQAETLQAANLALTQTLDQRMIMERLLDFLAQLVPYDSANTMLLDRNGFLCIHSQRGYENWTDAVMVGGLTFDPQTTPNLAHILATGESYFIDDTQNDSGWQRVPGTEHVRSWMGIPLIAGGRVVGLYGVDKATPNFFTVEHLRLAAALAAQAAVAIENAQLYKAEQRARHHAEILSAASIALTQTLDLDVILNTLLDYLGQLVPYDSAATMLLRDDNTFTIQTMRGFENWTADMQAVTNVAFDSHSNQLISQMIADRASRLVPDTRAESYWERPEPIKHVLSWLGVPLVVDNRVIGFYSIDKAQPDFFTIEHLRLAEGLAAQTAIAVQNSRLYRETQEALENNRSLAAYLTTLLQSTTAGFFGIDTDLNCTFINRPGATLLGYEPEELQGQPIHELIHHSYADGAPFPLDECPIALSVREGAARHVPDGVFWRKDGTYFEVNYSSHPIFDNGAVAGAVVTFTDISELKRAEEARRAREAAEQASRAKSEFLARMSHELRTPLNSIIGFSRILHDEEQDEERREYLGYVLQGGKHLLSLINEVLDISRVEAGRLDLNITPILIDEVLRESMDLVWPMASERGLQVQVAFQQANDLLVLADRQRLRQVLLNFLSNAVKYNRDGGSITVGCEIRGATAAPVEDAPALHVRIMVIDSGIGIPAAKLQRLFVPFDRLDAELSAVEGTGLGLALSKLLVEAMGGEIGVHSVVGEGSTFWMELPTAQQRWQSDPYQLQPEPEWSSTSQDSSGEKQYTVLYIEDNSLNRALVDRALSRNKKIRLITMPSATTIDTTSLHGVDLILLDLNLPDIPGEIVLQNLKSNPATANIPVVVLSADASSDTVNHLLALGATDYLTKPLDIAQFVQTVNDLLALE